MISGSSSNGQCKKFIIENFASIFLSHIAKENKNKISFEKNKKKQKGELVCLFLI